MVFTICTGNRCWISVNAFNNPACFPVFGITCYPSSQQISNSFSPEITALGHVPKNIQLKSLVGKSISNSQFKFRIGISDHIIIRVNKWRAVLWIDQQLAVLGTGKMTAPQVTIRVTSLNIIQATNDISCQAFY